MKAALLLSLAAAATAAKLSLRTSRLFETEAANSADVVVKFNLDIAALEKGAAASAEPRQYVHDFLQEASKKNLAKLGGAVSLDKVVALPIGGAAVIKNADKAVLDAVAALESVTYIDLNAFDFRRPEVLKGDDAPVANSTKNEWGIDAIGAPEIWKYSTGKGVVVGSIDTGAYPQHEAIKDSYRDDYNWFDPYNKTTKAYDSDGHGSHTIGTMVGVNGIGVAPGAKWISCLGLYQNSGSAEGLLGCAQFMLCPTKPDGTGADCKKGPHVVNNSWGGYGDYNPWFEDAIAAWKAANIIPIFAHGNAGPVCSSGGNPGVYKTVISVGAMGSFTNEKDKLAFFSSKGPSTINGVAIVKPDISAPGFFTRSVGIKNPTEYVLNAGTSMAAPHVSGVVAIMKSVDPKLTYDQVYKYLVGTTDQKGLDTKEPAQWYWGNQTLPGAPNCGGVKDDVWPNNRFGHGRVNVGTILRDGKLNDGRRPVC